MALPNPYMHFDLVIRTPGGGLSRSRLYCESDTAPTTHSQFQEWCNSVQQQFATELVDLLAASCQFKCVEGRYVAGAVDLDAISNMPEESGSATNLDDVLGDQDVYEFQRRTGASGRNARGRIFLSGVPELAQQAGVLVVGWKIKMLAMCSKLAQDFSIQPAVPGPVVVAHWRHYDRKVNVLRPIVVARASEILTSRRDRRPPNRITPIVL